MQFLTEYINNINRLFRTSSAREHSYRGHLETVLNQIIDDTNIVVTNEPARIRDVGAPDYSIAKKDIPIGYIEAKDIDKDLSNKAYTKQFERYKNALDNLIITNYINFEFYQNGELVKKISIAKIDNNQIIPLQKNFSEFVHLIKNFTTFVSKTIKSPLKLASLMANKALLLKDVLTNALNSDEESSLNEQLRVFQTMLIYDITKEEFADIFAQTIAFGMFIARYHDYTLENFSRSEARQLIPKSHPFLKGLFKYISDDDILDDRLIWIIDSLSEVYLATNIREIFEKRQDPIIHFYETFLSYYSPNTRKARGVWYTPKEVVGFIVNGVDKILKDEFDLDGLIDESKIKIRVDDPNKGHTKSGKKIQKDIEIHKVQILDPAVGTGTFLAEVVEFIKKDFFGSWSQYVNSDLIPRLNGFELLMASYAMAHLKLDMILDVGIKKRLNIYLTNSLEPYHKEHQSLFASYLANESKEADRIKKETPVMVIMGNPPYAVSSSNRSEWIQELLKDYKKNLNERKINLDDDYIKFIRFAQYYIDKNGYGIVAYITNNSFLDGITHRQMRKSILESFDLIYILDLHGNSKKKETTPDGGKDENVFDIQQGVSINIFVKKTKSKREATVYHYDLYGKREFKYNFLNENDLSSIDWQKLKPKEPNYFFVPKDFSLEDEYDKGFKIDELFKVFSSGIETQKDSLVIRFSESELERVKQEILYDEEKIRNEYKIKDSRDWQLSRAREDLKVAKIVDISYRPFDVRKTFYSGNSKGIMAYPRHEVMKHMLKDNYALQLTCKNRQLSLGYFFIVKNISDRHLLDSAADSMKSFPLYLYQEDNSLESKRELNLNLEIIKEFEKRLQLQFNDDFNELDLLDYIYAILHHPTYRKKYKEFLKIDFPKVPYPNIKTFWQLVEFGRKLRALHLLEDKSLDDRIIEISGDGDMLIANRLNKKDVHIEADIVTLNINENVAITNIPLRAWKFHIGGYQSAQKWLKDRAGKELSRIDLKHYNKIINVLIKTDKIMKEIDEIVKI